MNTSTNHLRRARWTLLAMTIGVAFATSCAGPSAPRAAPSALIIESPQDRGVLDGPVIYRTADDGVEAESPGFEPARVVDAAAQEDGSTGGLFSDQAELRTPPPSKTTCEVEFLGNDLTSNRHNGLPANRLQIVAFYDGDPDSSPQLSIGLGAEHSIVVGQDAPGGSIETFGRSIETREYQLYHCSLDGVFEVSDVVPNGVIDGLAFAVMWRDHDGQYNVIRSNGSTVGAQFVGMWPLGFNRVDFANRTPEISDNFGRESARVLITGAALLDNGEFRFPVPSVLVPEPDGS